MFIQPDWFDVMQPGVGTNRFSYSFNDPINKADQNGNQTVGSFSNNDFLSLFWASYMDSSGSKASSAQASETASALGWQTGQSILTSPLRMGEELVSGYDYVQQNTVAGSVVLPDRMAIMAGNPIAIAGVVPIGRAGKLAEKAIDSLGAIAHAPKGGTYQLIDDATDQVVRNGRTCDHACRRLAHSSGAETKDLRYRIVTKTDDYAEQRGLEQMQLLNNRGPLDRIMGIANKNPKYDAYMDAARRYWERQ